MYNVNTINHINNNTARLAHKLKIEDELGKPNSKNADILFKDRKWNVMNKKQAGLINTTKTELELVAKNVIKKNCN